MGRNTFTANRLRRVLTPSVVTRRVFRKNGGGGNCTREPISAANSTACTYGNRPSPWSEVGRDEDPLGEVIASWPSLPPISPRQSSHWCGFLRSSCTFRDSLARRTADFPGFSRVGDLSWSRRRPPERALSGSAPHFAGIFESQPHQSYGRYKSIGGTESPTRVVLFVMSQISSKRPRFSRGYRIPNCRIDTLWSFCQRSRPLQSESIV